MSDTYEVGETVEIDNGKGKWTPAVVLALPSGRSTSITVREIGRNTIGGRVYYASDVPAFMVRKVGSTSV